MDRVREAKNWVQNKVIKPTLDAVGDIAGIGTMVVGDIVDGVGYVAAESAGFISDDAKEFIDKGTEVLKETVTIPLKEVEHGARITGRVICAATDVVFCDEENFIDNSVELGSEIVDGVDDIIKKPLTAAGDTIDAITGEPIADEAKRLYDKLEKDASAEKIKLERFRERIEIIMSRRISCINEHCKKLKYEKFVYFKKLTSSFACWVIEDIDSNKVAPEFNYQPEDIKGKDSIITIDFSENPLGSYGKALITLGILTRKEAKDSLSSVKENYESFKNEKARAVAEKKRIAVVSHSLKPVVEAFEWLLKFYDELLIELEYSVIMIKATYALRDDMYFDGEIDLYFMPQHHIDCFMATEKMTRVMHKIGQQNYVDESKIEKNQQNIDSALEMRRDFEKLQAQLAA